MKSFLIRYLVNDPGMSVYLLENVANKYIVYTILPK